MPDGYNNPPNLPPAKPYTWVPNLTPTGNATTFGFNAMALVRGQFRNDLPLAAAWGGSVYCAATGTIVSDDGSLPAANRTMDWPILAAFRPLARPSIPFGNAPSEPFVVTGSTFSWEVFVANVSGNPTIPNIDPSSLSAITVTYALTLDPADTAAVNALDAEDQQKIATYLNNPQNSPVPIIDWATKKYAWASVTAQNGGNPTYFPARDSANNLQELIVTDLDLGQTNPLTSTVTIKLGTGPLPANYNTWQSIKIANYYSFPKLKLWLYRAMIFDAARANIPSENLPCGLLEYAYPVTFDYPVSTQASIYPTDNGRPNFFVKIFSPEDKNGTIGMAHSINLRFLIFSMPAYGLNPVDIASAGTAGFSYVIFIGPVAGQRQLIFDLTPNAAISAAGRVIPLDINPVLPHATTLRLQKAVGSAGATPPGDGAQWTQIAEYAFANKPVINLDNPGHDFVGEDLWCDVGAGSTEWYRTVQIIDDGSQVIGPVQRNQLFIQRSILTLIDSVAPGTSTAETVNLHIQLESDDPQSDPMQAMPLAVWIDNSDSPLTSPVTFGKGAWTLNLSAACDDQSGLTTTHLFMRFWFAPEDEVPDPKNPHKWRATTEFYFLTDANGTHLVQGTPPGLDNLIVSPPLPQNLAYMELVRFIDGLSFGDGKTWKTPFTNRARLMVGLYTISLPTLQGVSQGLTRDTVNIPKITLDVDSQYLALETTILQIESNTLAPERVYQLNASRYAALGGNPAMPLLLTRQMVGGYTLSGTNSDWQPYSTTFASPAGTGQNPINALLGLLTLVPGGNSVNGKVAIPFNAVLANKVNDYSISFMADFVTNGASMGRGRVGQGTWTITLTLNRNAKDTPIVGCDYRLEAFLVTQDGTVTERIFRTAIVAGLGASSGTTVVFHANVQTPFIIGGTSTQLVMRLTCFPYSRNGSSIDITALQKSLALDAGTPPLGARIDSFSLDTNTVSFLNLAENDSNLSSPAFFENLPLVPPIALGGSDFWYIADPSNLGTFLIPSDQTFPISGVMFTPAWYTALPADMEVKVGAAGLGDDLIFVRTVLASSQVTQAEQSVTAIEDPKTGTIHLAHDDVAVAGQSVGMLSYTGKVVTYLQLSSFDAAVNQSGTVQGYGSGALVSMEGRNPFLYFPKLSVKRNHSGIVGLIAQQDTSQSSNITAAINPSSGAQGRWIGPNADIGDNGFGNVRLVAQGLVNPSVVHSDNDSLAYVVGWVDPGAIVMREVSPFEAPQTGELADGTLFVVDTDVNQSFSLGGDAVIYPTGSLNGKAIQTFSGVLRDAAGRITVAYSLEGYDGSILARTAYGGHAFGSAYQIVNLRQNGVPGSSALGCFGIALAYQRSTGQSICAFWCSGKIFVAPVTLQTADAVTSYFSVIQLVAGSSAFNNQNNAGNPSFAALQALGALRVDQEGGAEADVPQQRPGLFISESAPYQGNAVVYYRDSNSNLLGRQVSIGGVTSAAKIVA